MASPGAGSLATLLLMLDAQGFPRGSTTLPAPTETDRSWAERLRYAVVARRRAMCSLVLQALTPLLVIVGLYSCDHPSPRNDADRLLTALFLVAGLGSLGVGWGLSLLSLVAGARTGGTPREDQVQPLRTYRPLALACLTVPFLYCGLILWAMSLRAG
jgi:hypothetical protein